ncbi:hypothetical protein M9Y10_008470 [Tritrichomonas musculus]|uniref:Reticulon domain-containing protein n=1 Tax=Tritrichomonas musculus TaxID=1915356 RepID=A0ABR2IZA8_9EUKA
MSNIQISITKKKDVNDYINYALEFIPCASFLFSLIGCFASNDSTFVFCFTYILILAYHGLRIYLTATNKSFFGKKTSNDQLIKRIWLGKHIHIALLALALMLFHCNPLVFFVAYVLYSVRKAVRTFQTYVGPRVGDMKGQIDSFAKAVCENENVKRARGCVCVISAPYIFFAALFTFRFSYFLVFVIYVFNNTLYGLMGDDQQKWAYNQIYQILLNATKDNAQLRDTLKKVVEQLSKVKDFAKTLYPIPQNALETVQAGIKNLQK